MSGRARKVEGNGKGEVLGLTRKSDTGVGKLTSSATAAVARAKTRRPVGDEAGEAEDTAECVAHRRSADAL